MIAWCAALAWSAEPVLREARWQPVTPQSSDGPITVGGRSYHLARTGPDDAVRIRCPRDELPERLAVSQAADGTTVLVRGPFSSPASTTDRWASFAPSALPFRDWLVPDGCDLQRNPARLDPDGLARHEYHTDEGEPFATDGLLPDHAGWIALGADPNDRWLALRPPGPWNADLGTLPGIGEATSYDPWGNGPQSVRHVDGGTTWTIRGPLALELTMWGLGDAETTCIELDDTRHCTPTGPHTRTVVNQGVIERAHGSFEGAAVMAPITFNVLLADGEHALTAGSRALVNLSAHDPVTFRDGVEWDPSGTEVYAPAVADEEEEPITAPAAAEPLGNPPSTLLALPTDRTRFAETEARWLPMDVAERAGGRWVAPDGTWQVWLDAGADTVCTLTIGDRSWHAIPRSAIHRFRWTGPGPIDMAEFPSVDGCQAYLRVVGAQAGHDARSASKYDTATPTRSLTWTPRVGEDATLSIAFPQGHDGNLAIDLDMLGRGRERYEFIPLGTVQTPIRDSAGRQWSNPLRIPLGTISGPTTALPDQTVALRLTQVYVPGADEAAEAERVAQTVPQPGDLVALSRAIANAPDAASRADALRRRARALLALDQNALALEDWNRAARLEPADGANLDAAQLVLWFAQAQSTIGTDAWAPVEDEWVPEGVDVRYAAQRAHDGDYLAVARILDTVGNPAAARGWWRKAVLSGQIPDVWDRIAMYQDLARAPKEIDEPWTWPIKVLSTWEPLHHASGPVRHAREAWPARDDRVIRRSLYPDAWPADQVLALDDGWDLALPPSETSRSYPVRCRVRRAYQDLDACEFEVTDPQGRVVARLGADPWGKPHTLEVPPLATRSYLHVRPSWAVDAEILAPDLIASADTGRGAWRVPAAGRMTFDVLAPTVLRISTWDVASTTNELTVTVPGLDPTTIEMAARDQVLVPVDGRGSVTVGIQPARATRIDVDVRVADDDSVEPRSDRRLLGTGTELTAIAFPFADLDGGAPAVAPPDLPTARPPDSPPLTGIVTLGVGTVEGDPAPADGDPFRLVHWLQEIRLASRPMTAPVWIEAAGIHETSPTGSVFTGEAGTDIRWLRSRHRLWTALDASLSSGKAIDGTPLTVARGELDFTEETFVAPRWQVLGRFGGFARGVVNDVPAGGVDLSGGYPLWNFTANDHPVGLRLGGEGRYVPGPFTRVAATADLVSNAHLSYDPLDRARVGVYGFAGLPGLTGRAGFDLTYEVDDDDRANDRLRPGFDLEGRATIWPTGWLGGQAFVRFDADLGDGDFALFGGIRAFGNRDRAMDDLRPLSAPFKYLHDWGQDAAAERTWEVQ